MKLKFVSASNTSACLLGRCFFLLFMLAMTGTAHAEAPATLEPTHWNIGTIEEGDSVSLDVTVTNTSSEPVRLVRVFHSCECLSVNAQTGTIEPFRSRKVTLTLTAIGISGEFEYNAYFEFDDLAVLSFRITGTAKAGGAKSVHEPIPPDDTGKALVIHFFFSPSCAGCDEIVNGPVSDVLDKYGERVGFVSYDLSDTSDNSRNYRLMRSYESAYGVSEYAPVEVYVGQTALIGKEAVRDGLEKAVANALREGSSGVEVTGPQSADSAIENISLLGAVVFGLVDGINPCVFAGLVLFMTYLMASGMSGRALLGVGLVYAFAVYVTYFVMGLALLSFFHGASTYPVVRTVVAASAALFAFAGGVLSIRDSVAAYRDGPQAIWLRLPARLSSKVQELIRSAKGKYAVFGVTFFLGAVITVIEGACSGIQYVPACAMMVRAGETLGTRATGFLLLAVYNLAFVLPLLVLLALALSGRRFVEARSAQRRTTVISRAAAGVLLLASCAAIVWIEFF
ncbi:MAG: DUF1573 domain-containing protein [Planctomycetota bacterium]|nr:DUF1573 domain-containing protein [Planctomycetota bacterium]